ncbi:MAG: cytochrome c biogenesis protein ResB [Mariprofundales bacterium]
MNRHLINIILQKLGSMSLAVIILLALALASVIGTVLQQNQEQVDYAQQFGPLWYSVFNLLGLFDMYHAWWFLTLLGFLMLSLSVCLWRNIPRIIKEWRSHNPLLSTRAFNRLQPSLAWQSEDMATAKAQIKKVLHGWYFTEMQQSNSLNIRADKGRFRKAGYMLVHAGILVILIGGVASVQFGFRGNMNVAEGSDGNKIFYLKGLATESLDLPYTIRCNSFFIDYYPTGMPKEFRSNLTIIDNGKEVLTSDIIVNEPLYYKGTRIYQASFGDGGSIIDLELHNLNKEQPRQIQAAVYNKWQDKNSDVSLEIINFREHNIENMANPGEPKQLQNLGPSVEYIIRGQGLKTVKVKSFFNPLLLGDKNQGSFILVSESKDDRDYKPFYLGLDFSNPKDLQLFHTFTAKLEAADSTEDATLAAFKSAVLEVYGKPKPEELEMIGMRLMQAMRSLPKLPWPFIPMPVEYEQVYYTGLQVTEDPGMNIVWFGSLLLVLGLCIMFYWPHRKLWLVIREEINADNNGVQVLMAGSTSGNKLGFKREFKRLSARFIE